MTTKKEKKKKAILLIENSEQNADMYWVTKFLAVDAFTFIQTPDNKKILITSALEADRARKEAKVNEVINTQEYGKKKGIEKIKIIEVISLILKDLEVDTVIVPEYFGIKSTRELENKGLSVITKEEPFFEQRMVKTEQEIKHITEAQRAVENVLEKTLDVIKKSNIKDNLLYYADKPLTSEYLRSFIRVELLKKNCWCEADVIVSCGEQTSMPHMHGIGQLTANAPIIMDIYPRNIDTRYWADMTRTVVKGKASDEFKKLYYTVLEAQKMAIEMIKPGVDTFYIDEAVRNYFDSKGYETDIINRPMKGFFHSTGHGVGLDIHEYPNVTSGSGKGKWILEAGNVITIEPGLYYPKKESCSHYSEIGGVRIEDLLVVTKNGYKNLTKSPKENLMEL